ncbi:MAG: beta-propeller domain-containing protein [Acholeplasmataceae bacterium]|nr:beta-propeller domain-containing protein [Acholeplasmataceae bacterium]
MREFGIILLVLLTITFLVTTYLLIKDRIWLKRLNKYRTSESLKPIKPNNNVLQKRFTTLALSFVMMLAVTPILTFNQQNEPTYYVDKQMVNVKTVGSKNKLMSMIDNYNDYYLDGIGWSGGINDSVDMRSDRPIPETSVGSGDLENKDRDFIDTNNQVKGVQEADIIKTDGNRIFYAPYGRNQVSIIDVAIDGTASLKKDIVFEQFYLSTMFLTDDYVVLVGYVYENLERKAYTTIGEPYFEIWYPYVYSGAIYVYDKTTLEEVYVYKTQANFADYRVIDNKLYIVANTQINLADPRPQATMEYQGSIKTDIVDYNEIYYFDENIVSGITAITVLDLETFEADTKGYLGRTEQIHVSKDAIYTTSTYYDFSYYNQNVNTEDTETVNWDEMYKTSIRKFRILEDGSVAYVGSTKVLGFVGGQYWMDEYDGYFRVITSAKVWVPEISDRTIYKHRLYVLKENELIDSLDTISILDKGIGKPILSKTGVRNDVTDEQVKSVRFNGVKAHVVTFLQTDPLYTIDLSNPAFPVITNAIEEPGFSTYLHPWGEDYLVGIGNMATPSGMVTGIKLSVYDTNTLEPLQSYEIPYNNSKDNVYSYSSSEALYNPKAILVDSEKQIFAFAISTYTYSYINYDYNSSYQSEYLIFKIDFTKEEIISEPYRIEHGSAEYYFNVDRGVYIDNLVYTFSEYEMISVNYETGEIIQTIPLKSRLIS